MEISRKERPIKIRQQSSITPESLEKLFQHGDDEINKIYQLLGGDGIISPASIQTVIISGGSGGGGTAGAPVDAKFLMIGNDARFPDERAFVSNNGIKQVDGGANGNLELQLDINSLAVDTIVSGDLLAFEDITGGLDNKITFANLEATLKHDNLADVVVNEHLLPEDENMVVAGRMFG